VNGAAVVVTGASTGIGRAAALRLDGLGVRVFAGVRKEEDARSLSASASASLVPLQLDVTNEASIGAAAETVRTQLGDARLLGIVNNAGIAIGGPVEFVPLADWRRQLDVNVVGVVAVIQHFLPLLRESRGRIVNISSIGGRFSQPFVAPYVASKHALEAVSDALRIELRPWEIQVVLIEPGSIATPLWEKGLHAADALASAAPAQLSALYGRATEVMTHVVQREAKRGVPPQRVADVIVEALMASRPRTRYLVGFDARGMAMVRRLLPDRWRDEIIFRVTGLPRRTDT
jgi:NAD(P)-dependent dehydrogenase (short-subunit alcohol dehydrogenase family)